MEIDFYSEDFRKPLIWGVMVVLSELVANAQKEYKEGLGVPYLPAALEFTASMLRKHMDGPDHVFDDMRSKLAAADPYFYEAMEKLGFADPRKAWREIPPAPWRHDWTEDDFDEDEEEETAKTENRGPAAS